MLEEPKEGTFVGTCDGCGRKSDAIAGSRQLAITRLMLRQWHVRTVDGKTEAFCTACKDATAPPLASKRSR